MKPHRVAPIAAVLSLLVGAACSSSDTATPTTTASSAASSTAAAPDSTPITGDTVPVADATYRATIRRTQYGIPHIEAADFASVMFGQGYAFAEDRACTLLDQVVKVRSERSKWFGPGTDDANLTSDFAYLHLGVRQRAEDFWANTASTRLRDEITGWTAGFNHAVATLGNASLPGWCAGQAWADTTVTEVDLLAYFDDLMLLASSRNFLGSIGDLQPPASDTATADTGVPTETTIAAVDAATTTTAAPGSNGWAIGSEWSATGGGLLLANPHFPWEGELRLWESQLTVPGKLDIYGATLSGVPGVLIGFTEKFGWTHTVSAGSRFTAYRLPLTPGDPTSYTYDGAPTPMTSSTYSIDVLGTDGTLSKVDRTLWDSRYGPIIAVGPLGWDASTAYTLRDANLDNLEALEQFLGMDNAQSFDEFQKVHDTINGIPWVNTIAVSSDGRAWYADTAATPRLSAEAIAAYEQSKTTDLVVQTVADNGAFLLDGSNPLFEWTDAPGARDPGLVPFSEQPKIERRDYVFNSNNSYWLAHPDTPLTGFSPLHGGEGSAPGGRPHINDLMLRSSAGADGKYTGAEIEAALFSNRSLTGEQWRDALVAKCDASGRTDLVEACAVLAKWDLAYHTTSVGAVLWNTLLDEIVKAKGSTALGHGDLWAEDFDPARPMATPSGLKDDDATTAFMLDALGKAVTAQQAAGIALDAPLGSVQRDARPGSTVGISGTSSDDVANITSCCARGGSLLGPKADVGTFDGTHSFTDKGFIPVTYGSSFVMALEFTPSGPSARAVLTYGQPDDPADPDFTSQTAVWGSEHLRPVLFRSADIAADPTMVEYEVSQ